MHVIRTLEQFQEPLHSTCDVVTLTRDMPDVHVSVKLILYGKNCSNQGTAKNPTCSDMIFTH